MYKVARKIVLELESANPKEVVKVAGILRRLKNIFMGFTNPEYSLHRAKVQEESKQLSDVSLVLNQSIEKLRSAIKDGDVQAYDAALSDVKSQTHLLLEEIKKVNKEVTEPLSNQEITMRVYNAEEWKDPEKNKLILEQRKLHKSKLNEMDVPDGIITSGKKMKDYNWFAKNGIESITFKEGNDSAQRDALFSKIASALNRETNITPEIFNNIIQTPGFVRSFFNILTNAIWNGTVVNYEPAVPDDKIKNRQLGQSNIEVQTDVFTIPQLNIDVSLQVVLLDESAALKGPPRIMFKLVKRVKFYNIPENLKSNVVNIKNLVPKPIESDSDIEEKPKTKRKKSSSRRHLLLKLAGVDHSAYKSLSPSFWKQFVEMSDRLGAKPEDLAKVIYCESAFDPHATNVQNGHIIAKGLNQLIKSTALNLGMSEEEWSGYENTPPESQLKYVEKFFRKIGKATGQDGKWESATQLYVANFAPKYTHQAGNPNAILYQGGTSQYEHNKGLDRDKKGYIAAGDLAKSVQNKLPDHIVNAIQSARGNDMNVPQNDNGNEDALIARLFAEGPVEKLVRRATEKEILPTSTVLVSISSLESSYPVRMKYAQTLSHTLKEVIEADSTIHSDGNKIEILCSATGTLYTVSNAVKALGDCVKKAMELKKMTIHASYLPGLGFSKYAKVEK